MENVKKKIDTFQTALKTLESSIELFNKYSTIAEKEPTLEHTLVALGLRDSMIQRFEYCTDMLWKTLKIYLENVEKITLNTYSPKGIIRECVQAKILSEQEGTQAIDMIKKRNETSHIYRPEVAESIAALIPEFSALMNEILNRISSKVS